MQRVAVVGSGPGGLVVSRYLKQEGFEPVIFDQNERLGGQWSASPGTSGVWPSMRTNTSRIMTAFSDLRHEPGTATYPTNQQMHAYLTKYASESGLLPHLQLGTRVEEITRDGDGWKVRTRKKDGVVTEETFPKVVIASGRYSKPSIPEVPGLETFTGKGGVSHTFEYRNLNWSPDWKILVAGCGISALEIAGDLAMLGVSRVVSSSRKQRYVLLKLIAGAPAEHVGLTRFGALAAETFPMEDVGRLFKDFVVSHCGSPEDYGARKPPENIFEAGIALSQHFLPLVAEGRIHVKPWIAEVNGRQVRFEDGTTEEFDAILFGTGFPLHLPFLGSDIRAVLDIEGHFDDLFQFTFHPGLPGLAFVGMMELQGTYFPVLELQARWIAYTWSGATPEVPPEAMEEGIRSARSMRGRSPMVPMNHAAVGFARLAGVEPSLSERPELARALLFGPLSPISFRLNGKRQPRQRPKPCRRRRSGVRSSPESSADAHATDATARPGRRKERRQPPQPSRRKPEWAAVTSKYSSSRVPVFYPLAVFHSSILDTPDNLKVRSIARQAAGPSHLIQVDLTAKYQLISPVLNTLHT